MHQTLTMRRLMHILRSYPVLYRLAYGALRVFFRFQERFLRYEYDRKEQPGLPLETIREYNRHRTYGPRRRLCHAPFTNMHFRSNGDVNACCYNKNHSFGNISEGSLRSIWNSKKARALRGYIDNYNLDHGCRFCKLQLQSGNYAGVYASVFDPLPFQPDPPVDGPTEMTFELSDTCNLECRMCIGEYSSLIRANREKRPPLLSPYRADLLDELREFLPALRKATFLGGEPLLIDTYYGIWRYLTEHNPGCRIHVQTNATVLNDDFRQLLNSRQFHIGVSVDAWEKERFEAIRQHAVWEVVLDNIETYARLHREGIIEMTLNVCPLRLNWQAIPRILDEANARNIPVAILTVIIPPYLSLRSLSAPELEGIIRQLREYQPASRTAVERHNRDAYEGFLAQLGTWLEENRLKGTIPEPEPEPAAAAKALSDALRHYPGMAAYSEAERTELERAVAVRLSTCDEAVRARIYRSMVDSMAYFTDASMENVTPATLLEGFMKFIGWELEGIRFEKEKAEHHG